MAKRTTTSKSIDGSVGKDLDEALDFNLTAAADDLDIAASMEDLEAQISQAADELAREGRGPSQVAATATAAAPAAKSDSSARKETPAGVGRPDAAALQPVTPQPSSFAPANDDRQKDARAIALGLNRRASGAIYWIMAVISAVWVAGGLAVANVLYGGGLFQVRSIDEIVARPSVLALLALTVMPVILFWAFAVMMKRAQDLRLAAQSMTEMAIRLAEPESIAQNRVMSVSQAVRREVAAMGEGIERTLARAVELETLVHTEVNQIERSYSENEARIRALVDGLGSEREAVVTHAERVRASITGAHETLKDQLNSASDVIRDSILGASTKLSMTITNSGDALIDRINESGISIFDSIDVRLDRITDRITTSGEAFASLLDTRIATLKQTSEDVTRSMSDLLDERTTGMVSLLGGAARNLNREFESSLQGIERTLAERGQGLISEFQTRAEALDTGTQKLNAALEARARQINETLIERAREIATTFSDGKQQLSELIDDSKSKLGAEMADMVISTSTMLEARSSDFAVRLEQARHDVSHSFNADLKRLAEAREGIELSVEEHSRNLAESSEHMTNVLRADLERFAASREGIDRAVDLQVHKLAQGREILARALDEDLRRIDESRTLIDLSVGEHVRKIAEGREELARALRGS